MAVIRKGVAPAERAAAINGVAPNIKVDWEDILPEFTQRVTHMQIWGPTQAGKSSLAFSAPGPIALIDAGEKVRGVVERFVAQGKKIRRVNYGGMFKGDPKTRALAANACIERFKAAILDSMGWAKTIIIDTHTEAWEILRMARFGTLTPQGEIKSMYGPVNAEWTSIFKPFRIDPKCNLITVGMEAEAYKADKATGKMKQAGQKDFPYCADVRVRMGRNKDGGFVATLEKAWMNAMLEGSEYTDEEITFSRIMSDITETPEEEWQ